LSGSPLPEKIDVGTIDAQGIAVDAHSGHLLVTDHGDGQRVVVYDSQTGKVVSAIGDDASLAPGVVGSRLFNPSSVGADAAGNIYVGSAQPTSIAAYDATGKPAWRLNGIDFNNAVADSTSDGKDVFSGAEHYTMNYDQKDGKEWSWTGHTQDRRRVPAVRLDLD
jgi:hypothetical protein